MVQEVVAGCDRRKHVADGPACIDSIVWRSERAAHIAFGRSVPRKITPGLWRFADQWRERTEGSGGSRFLYLAQGRSDFRLGYISYDAHFADAFRQHPADLSSD